LRVAVAQFAAGEDWSENTEKALGHIGDAARGGAELLVLPEGILSRFTDDIARIRTTAQPLDGPFMTAVTAGTMDVDTSVVLGIHERADDSVIYNTLVVLRHGEVVTTYRKLHLYDAFGSLESDHVTAGDDLPPVFDCGGLQVGLMTCYDVRFPETARLLADAGADVVALPAAWVRGTQKERHWEVMVAARALENTCYVLASGECGQRNIGNSMIVDPMGVAITRLGDEPGIGWADLDGDHLRRVRERLPVLANRRFRVDPAPHAPTRPQPAARLAL
jgi:deaminated glutathione amidase